MEQQTSTPLSQQSQNNPVSPSKNNLPLILIGVVLIALVGGGMFMLGQRSQRPVEVKMIPTLVPTVPATPTTTVDETADWNIYKNTAYHYQIKYPKTWTIGVKGGADPSTFPAPFFNSPCNYDNGDTCSQILIDPMFIKGLDGMNPDFINPDSTKILSRSQVEFAGINARQLIVLEGNQGSGTDRLQEELIFDHNDLRFLITYDESLKGKEYLTPSDWTQRKIFDEMLKTFSFTD